jgi:hypothetical protein
VTDDFSTVANIRSRKLASAAWLLVAIVAAPTQADSDNGLQLPFTSNSSGLLQFDFQHATVIVDNAPEPDYGLFANGTDTDTAWLPDQNGISQDLRDSIRRESLRILDQALPGQALPGQAIPGYRHETFLINQPQELER